MLRSEYKLKSSGNTSQIFSCFFGGMHLEKMCIRDSRIGDQYLKGGSLGLYKYTSVSYTHLDVYKRQHMISVRRL